MGITDAFRCPWLGVGPSLSSPSLGPRCSPGDQSDWGDLHASLHPCASGCGEGTRRTAHCGGITGQVLRSSRSSPTSTLGLLSLGAHFPAPASPNSPALGALSGPPCPCLWHPPCTPGAHRHDGCPLLQVVRSYKATVQQTLDILFLREGSEFLSSTDASSRDSADRTIIAWDFRSSAKISNQIFHVRNPVWRCFRFQGASV